MPWREVIKVESRMLFVKAVVSRRSGFVVSCGFDGNFSCKTTRHAGNE